MKTCAIALSHDFPDLVDVIPSLSFGGVADINLKAFYNQFGEQFAHRIQSSPLYTFNNMIWYSNYLQHMCNMLF